MNWMIEATRRVGGTTITIATHDAMPAMTRRFCVPAVTIGLFSNYVPRTSLGCLAGAARAGFRPFGRLMVIPPSTEIEVRTSGEDRRKMIWCHIDDAGTAGIGLGWPSDPEQLASLLDLRSSTMSAMLRALAIEATTPGIGSEPRIGALSTLLLIELARLFDQRRLNRRGGLAPWQLRRLQEMIARHPTAPRLADLAAGCGIGERQLMRAFRETTGMTVGTYARSARIGAARRLLDNPELSIGQVATALGFTSPASFSNFVKGALGVSPSDYRRRHVADRRAGMIE